MIPNASTGFIEDRNVAVFCRYRIPNGAAALLLALALAIAPDEPVAQNARGAEALLPFDEERFDCADAFDLIAIMATFRCNAYRASPAAAAKIDAALARLGALALAEPGELVSTRIAFCPLAGGTGLVPAPGTIWLDDGLLAMSPDGLAEIVAHELEHVRQFAELGPRGFKCEYVRQMAACGGCQDRGHALEAPAYARQDVARERLLRALGIEP